MWRFEAVLLALKGVASAIVDSCAAMVVVGAAALAGLWTGINYFAGLLIAASMPAMPPPTGVPSFHCLMQLAHCIP